MLLFLFCFAPDEIWYIQTSLLCALFVAEVCVCARLWWSVVILQFPSCVYESLLLLFAHSNVEYPIPPMKASWCHVHEFCAFAVLPDQRFSPTQDLGARHTE